MMNFQTENQYCVYALTPRKAIVTVYNYACLSVCVPFYAIDHTTHIKNPLLFRLHCTKSRRFRSEFDVQG